MARDPEKPFLSLESTLPIWQRNNRLSVCVCISRVYTCVQGVAHSYNPSTIIGKQDSVEAHSPASLGYVVMNKRPCLKHSERPGAAPRLRSAGAGGTELVLGNHVSTSEFFNNLVYVAALNFSFPHFLRVAFSVGSTPSCHFLHLPHPVDLKQAC